MKSLLCRQWRNHLYAAPCSVWRVSQVMLAMERKSHVAPCDGWREVCLWLCLQWSGHLSVTPCDG